MKILNKIQKRITKNSRVESVVGMKWEIRTLDGHYIRMTISAQCSVPTGRTGLQNTGARLNTNFKLHIQPPNRMRKLFYALDLRCFNVSFKQ